MSTIQTPQNIVPFLWFDKEAEEAIRFYTGLFPNSEIKKLTKWPEGGPMPAGTVQVGDFVINGLRVHAFDAGPSFKFNEAVSFFVQCENQAEIDHYWHQFIDHGGEESQCGWLKDRYGFSWQIVPKELTEMLSSKDVEGAKKMMEAVMKMKKLEIAQLKAAFED
ncbi:VOC family protein [Echinicola strongylocentroti]|uniref:VOC family protein n=1 Tax=Echinicola strongylocentroti TaxID=1795355 RepID=A0A2Z4IEI0_9BACT|nr:VOC family protein [Echinicola strongylocentroti]AWW29077.1 VOC family protein [Echinicola strongylocentroti]